MRFKNLKLIGTSHIAKESVDAVKNYIANQKPDIVAVELDRSRLAALLDRREKKIRLRDIKRVGLSGFVFSLIGAWVEKKLGEKVGVAPGSEMLSAIKLAEQSGAKIALIDQDIAITLRRLSQFFSWKEKFRIVVDIIKGFVWRKSVISFDLRKVPSEKLIQKLMKEVKVRYPNLYSVLVAERNEVMAQRLAKLIKDFPEKRILAVVGAGHESELVALVKKYLNL
ncbi:TraB/GumN family protein [Candidatus Woesearchaeota archaeon]|nr:TraB/GumN family protein [Candidatus Woesearchaeota archaeon]